VTGKVSDEKGEPILGANITIKDSYDGASSDVNGLFQFISEEAGAQTLVVTFVGFKTFEQMIELNGKPIAIEIKLKEEINELEAVVISAGSFTAGEEKRRTILKAIDIATTAGATADIAGALNTLPGTQKVGESGRLFVRGGDGSEARTFIDGMLVLDAYGPAAPNTPSRGRFLPFMFKGTSFSTGGYSAEFGQALSSALVLNSKDIATLNQTDIGILSVGADVAHTQAWERASVSGKIQYTNLRPYMNMISQRVDWETPPASLEGSAAYRQKIGEGGMFKFYGNFNRSDFALYNHDIADPSLKQLFNLNNGYTHGNATHQHHINNQWLVRGGISYTKNKDDFKVDGSPLGQVEDGVHAKAVAEYAPSDKVEIRFGSELIDRKYSASRFNPLTGALQVLSFQEKLNVAFAETEMYASNKFVAKVGGRMEFNSLTSQYTFDPRASIAYKPGKQGQFSFAYGTFHQSAKNELVRYNNQLDPERAEHFILNYQIMTDRRTFRVEAYHKNYKDLVKYVSGNPTDLINAGNGNAKGFEFFWRDSQTIKYVDYWVSYSFLDTERDYLNYPYAATPSFASKHNFSFVYKHFIKDLKSQVGFTYSYSSGRTYFNPNSENFLSDKTPSYQDLSLNVSYLPKNWIIVYVSCTNLLGRENIFGYEYASSPNGDGQFASRAIRQPATRFAFLGLLITISKNKSVNQLPNL
jgi:TonB dependent receptor/CarboxypepD_reg-like domain